jgi:hypothetical protein
MSQGHDDPKCGHGGEEVGLHNLEKGQESSQSKGGGKPLETPKTVGSLAVVL